MTPSPTSTNRIHLAASLEGEANPQLTEAVAEAIGITVYDAQLRLRGGLPRSLLCCQSIQEAEAKAAAINKLGLATIVYEQDDLPLAEPVSAIRIGRTRIGLRIKSRDAAVDVPMPEIALLVHGKSMLTRETKELRPPMIIFPSDVARNMTLALSGGMHVSKHQTTDRHFLMLFRRNPQAPAIRIDQEGFNYTCLGKNRGRTRLESLQLLGLALRKMLPGVPFDECLLRGQSGNRGEAFYNRQLAADSSTANATLIYWRMLALQSGDRHLTVRRIS